MNLLSAMLLSAVLATAEGVITASDQPAAVTPVPWSEYFFQDFYHMSILPLLLMTAAFAWMAKPSTQEEIPVAFKRFQMSYLAVWSVCVAADWLQGPYVYALYSAYGFGRDEIAQLFVAGFGSSMAFGCIVGTLADQFGRKKMCMAYCVFYIISCLTKHWKVYSILMLGRITGGIATSMLFSCFECWLVSESNRKQFSTGLLSYMFGLMYTSMYGAAIASGLVAQFVADTFVMAPISQGSAFYMGGYCAPFDLAIACLIIGMGLIAVLWPENYGSSAASSSSSTFESSNFSGAIEKLKVAGSLFKTDKNMVLLCCIVACFEGSMYAFVFNWTPALDSQVVPPPHGIIFALFMMACTCGSSVATLLGESLKPQQRLALIFSIGMGCFLLVAIAAGRPSFLAACFSAFLAFEFCCGFYFPSVGVLKSELVPEQVRGTMYNIYRLPLNAVVVCLLLSNITMIKCFVLCASLLLASLVAVININTAPCVTNGASTPEAESSKQV